MQHYGRGRGPSVWDAGWGLPVVAGLFSLVISVAVATSFLATARVLTLPQGWFEGIFAILAFLSQWGANISLMRARKNKGVVRFQFLIAFGVLAVCSAVGVHHVQSAYRDIGYQVDVAARETDRAPYEQLVIDQRLVLAHANAQLAENATRGDLPAARIRELNAGLTAVITQASSSVADAEQRLETMPALPETRVWDRLDTLFALIAALIVLLEFVWYWGMQDEMAASNQGSANAVWTGPPVQPARRGIGLTELVAAALAALGISTAAHAGTPDPQFPLEHQNGQANTQLLTPVQEQEILELSEAAQAQAVYDRVRSEPRTAAIMSAELGRPISRRTVRKWLGRQTVWPAERAEPLREPSPVGA